MKLICDEKEKLGEMKRKDTRPLTVNKEEWEYKIGKNTVAIYASNGERYFPKFWEVINVSKSKFEEEISFQLNPAVILYYIETSILKVTPTHHRCHCCWYIKSDAKLRVNPFESEINDDHSLHFLCNSCCRSLEEEI